MKMTRILAALLCVMMVVCSLPMMAMAAIPSNTYNTIGELMGASVAEPVVNDPAFGGMNLDFRTVDRSSIDNDVKTWVYCTSDADFDSVGFSYNSANGLSFPTGTQKYTWHYYPASFASSGWSPLNLGAYIFRFKLDAGGTLEVDGNAFGTNWRTFIQASETGVTIYSGKNNTDGSGRASVTNTEEFAPGTEWCDMLVIANGGKQNSTGGYSVYMKKATDAGFTLVAAPTTYPGGGYWKETSYTSGMNFTGYKLHISDAVMLKTASYGPRYDSIEDIIGAYTTTYNYELDNNFQKGVAYGGQGINAETGTYTEDGFTNGDWGFEPYNNFCPLSDTTAFSIEAKGKINLRGRGVDGRQMYLDISASGTPYANLGGTGTSTAISTTVRGEGNWGTYLFVKNGASGYTVYLKAASTENKWEKVFEATNGRYGRENNSQGIYINMGTDGYVKNVKVYSTANVVSEANAKPAGATELLYSEDFAAKPAYSNIYGNGISYDGNMVLTENAEADAEVWLENVVIPVGGYAEYRFRVGDTAPYIHFYTGTHDFNVMSRVDYCYVPGKAIPVSEGGDTYRTFRIARTAENTYNVYCKTDEDSNWYGFTGLSGTSASYTKCVRIPGEKSYAGAEGVAKLDYLKIYGPAINDTLTLTDGYGTITTTNGATLKFKDSLRAIVKADTGKLLVATYTDNDMLKAQIVDVASMTDDSVIVNAKVSGGNKIKVFYWDSFTKLNSLESVVTFAY